MRAFTAFSRITLLPSPSRSWVRWIRSPFSERRKRTTEDYTSTWRFYIEFDHDLIHINPLQVGTENQCGSVYDKEIDIIPGERWWRGRWRRAGTGRSSPWWAATWYPPLGSYPRTRRVRPRRCLCTPWHQYTDSTWFAWRSSWSWTPRRSIALGRSAGRTSGTCSAASPSTAPSPWTWHASRWPSPASAIWWPTPEGRRACSWKPTAVPACRRCSSRWGRRPRSACRSHRQCRGGWWPWPLEKSLGGGEGREKVWGRRRWISSSFQMINEYEGGRRITTTKKTWGWGDSSHQRRSYIVEQWDLCGGIGERVLQTS